MLACDSLLERNCVQRLCSLQYSIEYLVGQLFCRNAELACCAMAYVRLGHMSALTITSSALLCEHEFQSVVPPYSDCHPICRYDNLYARVLPLHRQFAIPRLLPSARAGCVQACS